MNYGRNGLEREVRLNVGFLEDFQEVFSDLSIQGESGEVLSVFSLLFLRGILFIISSKNVYFYFPTYTCILYNSFYLGNLLSKLFLLDCFQNLSFQTLNKPFSKPKAYVENDDPFLLNSWLFLLQEKHQISIIDHTKKYHTEIFNF